jgi:hypothetical protein
MALGLRRVAKRLPEKVRYWNALKCVLSRKSEHTNAGKMRLCSTANYFVVGAATAPENAVISSKHAR